MSEVFWLVTKRRLRLDALL